MMIPNLQVLVLIAALSGFFLTIYMRRKKMASPKFVCPIGADCDEVMNSSYSTLFYIPLEFLGMLYYGLISLTYGLSIFSTYEMSETILFGVLILSGIAFLFSLYLTFLQAFVLHRWCSWCLVSAGLCTIIFLVSRTLLG